MKLFGFKVVCRTLKQNIHEYGARSGLVMEYGAYMLAYRKQKLDTLTIQELRDYMWCIHKLYENRDMYSNIVKYHELDIQNKIIELTELLNQEAEKRQVGVRIGKEAN